MILKVGVIPGIVILLVSTVVTVAAQNPQNWATNEANQIQQDASSGLINPNQATKLETRDVQIQAQEQQYLKQNGGKLTPQEKGQISSELRNLNQRTGQDVKRDNPNLNYNNSYPQAAPPWQNRNGFNPNYANPYNMQNPAIQGQSANGNSYPHHHHHRFNQGQQVYPNNNGQQQYWQH